MRKIIFVFLFFCFAITTVLAQAVIEIETPDSNRLSNNQVDFFEVLTSGTILNNSAVDGTATLGSTAVTGNPDITAGSEATLILFQVTEDGNRSTLDGTIEVFGTEAGIIIANPNGIECNGCAFTNANRVDLVEGTYNIDTGISDISSDGGITVGIHGLDAASVGILNIQTNNFANDGEIDANTFNLSVAGNFNYNGTISAVTRNFNVAGIFSYDDSATDFTWATNDRLTVGGTADIVADSYIQYGVINVAGAWSITANDFIYDNANDFVWGANDSLTVIGGTASINTYNFDNSGSINGSGPGSSLNITAGYTVINRGTITATSLDITADDFFRNLTGGNIDVASLNIIAGGKVTNTATINVSVNLTITADNDSSRTNDTTGFYVSNRGNITAGGFIINAEDNFYNRGTITTGIFSTSAKDIFLLNEEIDSFYAAGYTYYGGTITIGGPSDLVTDGGIIENHGNIDLSSDVVLTIVADSFTNQAGATISDGTLYITTFVTTFVNDGVINATIISDTTIDQ